MNYIKILILLLIIIIIFCFINIDYLSNTKDNTLDEYTYYQSNDDEYIYYVNMFYNNPSILEKQPIHYNAASFYMDKNKNIIQNSRHFFYDNHFNEKPEAYNIIKNITDDQLNNAVYIGENIIGITKWQILYGHVHDELYSLYDFYDKISKKNKDINYKILYEFTTDNNLFNYPYENIEIINNYLFNNINIINPYTFNYNIIKMKKVIIIDNHINTQIMHSFPKSSNYKILSEISNNNINNNNVYISRSKCLHRSDRNLDNEDEIVNYLLNNNYVIINPENMIIDDFINNIRNANNIVITWGSALTNMVYLKNNANVYILKAKGYDHENFDLFTKIVKNYNLNIKIINNNDNKIIIPFL